ncbi:myeloid cell surface antigen CD33-like isoform X1 [Xiphophorus hellerii]|uniref:myeloid cell surface antigen CD33-like isoform X1 n=1 Tax=Xiphophorus hellerii TaxID=8084 RepID=UPI0013B43DD4|nr:myeloid cell surface antigen CD33-like isoform X1 [Xiphophorus hellerii]XP_032415299.1 myeloid cell surface antigen CD33-like isoform X1 [Xiphophorus hellerii]XP_032415300.1 myeloid cell surface antigen CD33-like isoform X1 [Xiphophorus hellerii]
MEKDRKMIIFFLFLAGICSSVLGEEWTADVVKSIDALVGSCVVLPCTVSHPGTYLSTSRLRGIWHRKDKSNEIFYHEDSTQILDSFKGRTRLLGNLGQNNCTLEIVQVKDHDNGPFCFRIELVRKDTNQPTKEKFSFVEKCADVTMIHDKPKLKLGSIKTAIQGKPYTLTCSVHHTCPSHFPQIKWSRERKDDDITEVHKHIHSGIWEAESILSFVPEEKDDESELTCTATFNGGIKSEAKFTLNVKRQQNYNHIIIPAVAVAATAVIFGLFCVLMVKKYKKRIQELQSQDGRRSVWSQVFTSRHQRGTG